MADMILVSGGTGLVGSHLLLALVKGGHKVRAIRRAGSQLDAVCRIFRWYEPKGKELFDQIEWVEGDVCDPVSLDSAFEGVNMVYHCAAVVSFRRSDADMIGTVNIQGTANIVNACLQHKVSKLCHVSSIAALGTSEDGRPVDERTPWNSGVKHSPYGLSKFAAEREVWRGIEEGLNAVIVNPSVILGPGEPEKAGCRLFAAIKKGLIFYPPGANGFVDVRDVVKIMMRLVEKDVFNERFLISGENLSFLELFRRMSAKLERKPPHIEVPAFALQIIWRLNVIISRMLRINPELTQETARNAYIRSAYDNQKVTERLSYEFLPIEDTIENLKGYCSAYNKSLHPECRD